MRKTIAAVTAGLLLVAGQSWAQAQVAAPIVDRVGEVEKDDNYVVPLAVLAIAAIVLVAASSGGGDDRPESA